MKCVRAALAALATWSSSCAHSSAVGPLREEKAPEKGEGPAVTPAGGATEPAKSSTVADTPPERDPLGATAAAVCNAPDAAALDPRLSPQLRAHVTAAQLFDVLAELRKEHGPCETALAPAPERIEYRHARAIVRGRLYLDEGGKITGIWFGAPERTGETVEQVLAALEALPGEVAVSVIGPDTAPIARRRSDRALAVGSTFKLYILKALAEDVAAGRRRWSDLVELDPRRKSLPSGRLQDWPDRAPITLHSLATLMISESDNTATDHLLFLIGRERVEAAAGARNRPFLSTLEAFKLTSESGQAIAERFAAADVKARRVMLRELEPIARDGLGTWRGDRQLESVGWFFSTDELCDVIRGLSKLELLGVNRGLARRDAWRAVRFKGTEVFDELVSRLIDAVARSSQ